jgi:dTDP-4-amino-4,6-dideoxygalactose transaminase
MDEMSAALGLSQFKRIGDTLAKRQRIAGWYLERLSELKYADGSLFDGIPERRKSWFVYNLQVPSSARDYLLRRLASEGVDCKRYFDTPVHCHPAYAKLRGEYPIADWLAARGLTLPMFNEMTEAQVTYVCKTLGAALRECRPELGPYAK